MKFIIYPISALIIGISLIIGASILKGTILTNHNGNVTKNSSIQLPSVYSTNIMTKKQLSEYLQVSEETIDSIMKEDNKQKAAIGNSYDTYMFLPYLKIGNQERFLKTEIDKWLQYQNKIGI
jgi:predicted DNA-binding transcriptional regulator AlpA